MSAQLASLEALRISIPFRASFRHATAKRDVSENLIVIARLSDGTVGYGEAIARTYVSGETVESAAETIQSVFAERLAGLAPTGFADLLNELEELPLTDAGGLPIVAARCAVELALLDAYGKHFGKGLQEVAGWLGLPGLTTGGSLDSVRFSGVVSADEPAQIRRKLWKMRLFGLRDFKIKLGGENDQAVLEATRRILGRALRTRRVSLRADVNGVWDLDKALEAIPPLADYGICCLEQPLPAKDISDLALLHAQVSMPIMADESLVLPSHAQALIDHRCVDYFNIRITKNGGLIPSLRLAHLASKAGIAYQLGCLVGETAILSAAGRWFLSIAPRAKFAEGSYGTFLLLDDISTRPSRFGYGGRVRKPLGPGLGVGIDVQKLGRYQTSVLADIKF